MLEVKSISKKYKKVKAIDNVSFSLNKGEVVILVGPNGAGKSTTIKSIVGILRYDGEISIDGYNNKSIKAKKLISYVPELPSLFPLLTVREHIEYILRAYDKKIDDEKIDNLLKRFDLYDKQDKFGDELSKGMMQKVSICAALVVDAELLIFDEPMIGLDPKAIKELKKIIIELRDDNKTVLISTHMMEMIEGLWDRVLFMKEGKVISDITRKDNNEEDLEDLFFEIMGDYNE